MASDLRPYQKKCSRCGKQILMHPNNGHWKALEVDSKEPHMCMQQQQQEPQQQEQNESLTNEEIRILKSLVSFIKSLSNK